jgi:hypothetical protein
MGERCSPSSSQYPASKWVSTAGDRTLNNDGERESCNFLDNKIFFMSRGLSSAVSSKIRRIKELK